eukprot:TRINITY_DN29649_c0_g1_i1.p1 TRINITY_DN29649_c0_g1~~TRINITY_DN29649_c0_g1_i1.p1  ORF type:complete len:735 (+),score=140.56 TRINITY_DN29649_c0_g1_i1:26-2230(+)
MAASTTVDDAGRPISDQYVQEPCSGCQGTVEFLGSTPRHHDESNEGAHEATPTPPRPRIRFSEVEVMIDLERIRPSSAPTPQAPLRERQRPSPLQCCPSSPRQGGSKGGTQLETPGETVNLKARPRRPQRHLPCSTTAAAKMVAAPGIFKFSDVAMQRAAEQLQAEQERLSEKESAPEPESRCAETGMRRESVVRFAEVEVADKDSDADSWGELEQIAEEEQCQDASQPSASPGSDSSRLQHSVAERAPHKGPLKGLPQPPSVPQPAGSLRRTPARYPGRASYTARAQLSLPVWNSRKASGKSNKDARKEKIRPPALEKRLASDRNRARRRSRQYRPLPDEEAFCYLDENETNFMQVSYERRSKTTSRKSGSEFQALQSLPAAFRNAGMQRVSIFGDGASWSPTARHRSSIAMRSPEYSPALESEMAHTLRGKFENKMYGRTRTQVWAEQGGEDQEHSKVEMWHMHRLAKQYDVSLEDAILVKDVFASIDKSGAGVVSFHQSEEVIQKLFEVKLASKTLAEERMRDKKEKLMQSWRRFVRDESISLNYQNLILWYSTSSFMADMLLDEKEMRMRKLAQEHHVVPNYLDKVRGYFEMFDTDNSGWVDFNEFGDIMNQAFQVPPGHKIPESRVRFFWNQLDSDDSGKVEFDEFLAFWLQNFKGGPGDASLPFEDFYKSVRRLKSLDPPWRTLIQQPVEETPQSQPRAHSKDSQETEETERKGWQRVAFKQFRQGKG